MKYEIFASLLRTFIRITVFTSVQTRVVRTYVAAFDAMASVAQPSVFYGAKAASVCLAEDVERRTAG